MARSQSVELTKADIAIFRSWFDASNAKAAKGRSLGYLNAIHYMAPASSGGAGNVCPWAARCVKPCLTASGRGGAPNVHAGRIRRARMWHDNPGGYLALHRAAIDGPNTSRNLIAVARSVGLKPVLRLNGTSDISYEEVGEGILHDYPSLSKLDYTKGWERVQDWLYGRVGPHSFRSDGRGYFSGLKRYHLTLSLGGILDKDSARAGNVYRDVLDRGGTVAAVWISEDQVREKMKTGITEFQISDQAGNVVQRIDLGRNRRVVDGNDANGDIRFLDPQGVIVGLYAKGRTEHLDTGAKRFFMHNPSSSRSRREVGVVTGGLPMGAMVQDGPHHSIETDPSEYYE